MPQLLQSVSELAANPEIRACLDWFRRERGWINEQHARLCRIPAPTFFEQRRAEWFAEQFHSLGWHSRLDRAGNVIARRPDAAEGPYVAVSAHLDTVFAPRTPEDIRMSSDHRFQGPGVADNGPGLAALLAVAAAWEVNRVDDAAAENSAAAPVLIANVGEEGEGNLSGMRYICRQPEIAQARGFLVLDGPGTEHITSRALASRRFEVIVTGPGGHSWRDADTGNPVHALSRAITLFTDEARRTEAPRTTFNFGIFEGGSSINSIPNEARTKIDLRSERAENIDAMASLLTWSVERAIEIENERSSVGRISARIKEIGSRPSGALPDDAPILECVRAVDAHLGIRSHLDCSSTDANVPLSIGVQAVSMGAGGQGGGAHTSSEWFSAEGRELGLRRIFLSLMLLLSSR